MQQSMLRFALAGSLLFLPIRGFAQTGVSPGEEGMPEAQKIYSQYVERTAGDRNFSEGLYWGDTHLHTGYSTDAGMIGQQAEPLKRPTASPWERRS